MDRSAWKFILLLVATLALIEVVKGATIQNDGNDVEEFSISEDENSWSNDVAEDEDSWSNDVAKDENPLSNDVAEAENSWSNDVAEAENSWSNDVAEAENSWSNDVAEASLGDERDDVVDAACVGRHSHRSRCHRRGRRLIVGNITVPNGGPWGSWGVSQFCRKGTYAIGYNMKIERKQKRSGDNTALNAISLVCGGYKGKFRGRISSKQGYWGSWVGRVTCRTRTIFSIRRQFYLTAFDLQVQRNRSCVHDETAANYIKFHCRDFRGQRGQHLLVKSPGHGNWGTWGPWSHSCPKKSAICGIRTKVQSPQGISHDDTALNDVMFYCCRT